MGWRSLGAGIVLAQLIAVIPISAVAGWRYELPLISYWMAALGIAIIGSGLHALLVVLSSLMSHEPRPAKAVVAALLRSDLPLVAFLVGTQLALLGWLKATMPYAVGFWADPLLAELDVRLFGVEPWIVLHRFPLQAIDRIYLTWGPFCAAVAIALSFAPNDQRKGQCLVAYFLTVASCALGQYLLPSAGPVFFEALGYGDRFAELPILPWVQTTADYLWITYKSPDFLTGSGISAFPSLHVAGAFWIALVARIYLTRFQLIGWAYWLTILIGSVYLGWHYAIDGIAGSALAFMLFFVAGRFLPSASGTPTKLANIPKDNCASSWMRGRVS